MLFKTIYLLFFVKNQSAFLEKVSSLKRYRKLCQSNTAYSNVSVSSLFGLSHMKLLLFEPWIIFYPSERNSSGMSLKKNMVKYFCLFIAVPWCSGNLVLWISFLYNFILQILISGSVQIQILLTTCWKFAMVSILLVKHSIKELISTLIIFFKIFS